MGLLLPVITLYYQGLDHEVGLTVIKKGCILCPSGIATLDIERPALSVESTGLDFETSCKDVSRTDETTIGNSGTLGKAF